MEHRCFPQSVKTAQKFISIAGITMDGSDFQYCQPANYSSAEHHLAIAPIYVLSAEAALDIVRLIADMILFASDGNSEAA